MPETVENGLHEADEDEDRGESDEEGGFRFDDIYIPPPYRPACTFDSTGPRLIVTSIENENFKSYAGRQVLGPFHKRFNSIVGPNGSGKSNVIDSMLFVFGYRASKLRSKKISVLLHNSDKHRDIRSCTVTVNFVQIIDKGDDYEIVPNSKIVISRTAFKDNTSFYTLNGRRVHFKEIAKLLRSHGVDLDFNRFLILQGEVEQIAMMKPKGQTEQEVGMLEYLEDIIGTSRYKEPIEKLNERLDELVQERSEKVNRVKYAEQEKNKLEGPKNECIEYLRLKNEVTKKRNVFCQLALRKYKLRIEESMEAKKKLDEEFAEMKEKIKEIQSKKKEMTKEIDSITKEYGAICAKKDAMNEKFNAANAKDMQLQEDINQLSKSRKKTKELLAEERKKLQTLEQAPEKAEKEIKELTVLEEKLIGQRDKEQIDVDKALEKLKTETKEQQAQKEQLQTRLITLQKSVDETKSVLDIAQSALDLYLSSETKEKSKLTEMQTHFESVSKMVNDKRKEMEELQVKIPKTSKALKTAEDELARVREEQTRVNEELQTVRVSLAESRSNMQAMQSRGQVVTALMREKQAGRIPGIFGRLGDLGAIDKLYDVAVTTACGRLDNIVVDTVDTAQRCIEFLKANNVGRTTFIALEKQEHLWNYLNAPFQAPGPSKRLFDLIRVEDERVRTAFYFALRDTLVTNTLQEATEVAYGRKRHRVVTLEGQIIEPTGTMSGGGRVQRRGGMGQQVVATASPQSKGNLEAKLTKLDAAAVSLREQRNKLEREVETLSSELNTMQMELNRAKADVQTMEGQVPILQQQVKQQQEKVKQTTSDPAQVKKLTATRDTAKKAYEKAAAAADEVDAQVKEHHAKLMEITGSRTKAARKQLDEIIKKIDKVQKERAKLTVGIKTSKRNFTKCKEKITNMEFEVEDMGKKLLKMQEEKEVLEKQGKECLRQLESLGESNLEMEGEVKKRKEAMAAESKKENDLKAAMTDSQPRLDEINATLKENKGKLNATKNQLDSLKLHEIPGDLSPGELVTLTEEELLKVDESALSYEVSVKENELSNRRPNMAVLEEYKEKEAQYINRVAELEEVTNRRNKARSILEDVRKRRLTDFMDGYTIITTKLREMYQTITLGGDAEFELVDTLDPFSEGIIFSVRPPKKSWKNISNLSGGEKTLASLALVFALHYYKPSPLYIMDEIDAALDFRNVSIVGNYIKERTKNAQFIVISLRANMFELADHLVGIYKTYDCTKSVTINPNNYNTI
ncbi:structural maintenance of chromosomes protein 4 [Anabrus simplex]|uniref:structural maintenance of chromosomes protein 4 n=1 Tax=Anabrus simplex TaxID=316456 RepID=UPI0035A27D1A